MIYASLAEIQSFRPCGKGWKEILIGQKKTIADGVLFPLTEALESNSIADVCWLLGKRKKEIQIAVRFARMCAESVSHLKNKYVANAADAACAAADAANCAAYAAAYANAANAAAYANAAYAADAANVAYVAADAAYHPQNEKNKQFLIQCITEWNEQE